MTALPAPSMLERFRRNKSGVAAVEFALILPVMLMVYIGGVEATEGIGIRRKVAHAASAISDLVAQDSAIGSTAEMQDIFKAGTTIVLPFDSALLKASVIGIAIDDKNKATVSWAQSLNGAACPAKGSAITVPANLSTPSSFLVLVQTSYAYTPKIGYVLTGSFDIGDQLYQSPRDGKAITAPSCS